MSNQELKVFGENAAAEHLAKAGLRIVCRNWRTRFGELDLVAFEGRTLVFVEVKARSTRAFVDPALAVDHRKQGRLRRLAGAFLAIERPSYETVRFDVVSVVPGPRGPEVDHIPNAF